MCRTRSSSLSGRRQLVLFDDAAEIFLATCRGNQPDLAVLSHDLAVKIKARLRVRLQRSVTDELLKISAPFA